MTDPTPADHPTYPSYPGDGVQPDLPPLPPTQAPVQVRYPEKVERLAVVAIVAALLMTLADVVQAGLAYGASRSYLDAADQGLNAEDVFTAYDIFGLAWLPLGVLAYVSTSWWMFRMRTNVDLLRPNGQHSRGRGWAWGGWIVPVVSLWFPFQYIRDLLREHRHDATPPLIGWWWALFLASLIFDRIGTSLLGLSGPIDRTAAEALPGVETFGALLTIIACVLWFRVISRLRADQRSLLGTVVAPGD